MKQSTLKQNTYEAKQHIFKRFTEIIQSYDPNLTPVQWAEMYRVLPKTVVSEKYANKKMNYNVTPYLREVVDNMNNADVERVAIMKGTQLGFSQGVLETAIGWAMHSSPAPMAYVAPTLDLSKDILALRIVPMINLSGLKNNLQKIEDIKTKAIKATSVHFTDGFLLTLSGKNAVHMSSYSLRYMFIDEMDKIPEDVKQHGNIEQIADARTTSFLNERKIYYISSPLYKETSNIYKQYLDGDQRRWHVPCPHCGEYQILHWNGDRFFDNKRSLGSGKPEAGLKFETDENGRLLPETIYYLCKNGCVIKENEKYNMNLNGRWIPSVKSKIVGYRSYHISAIPSNLTSWQDIIQKFIQAKDDINSLQGWVNNNLGEPWSHVKSFIDASDIKVKNIRPYKSGIVPNQLALSDGNSRIINLVCSVDVNGFVHKSQGWLAVDIKGYCVDGQSYSIAKVELTGNLAPNGAAWQALSHIIKSEFLADTFTKTYKVSVTKGDQKIIDKVRVTYNSQAEAEAAPPPEIITSKNWNVESFTITQDKYNIAICTVDAGVRTDAVYDFVYKHLNAVAVRGRAMATNDSSFYHSKNVKDCRKYYFLNVNKHKNTLFENFANDIDKVNNKQPKFYMNFPSDQECHGLEFLELQKKYDVLLSGAGFDAKYFTTFESEYRDKKGSWIKKDSRAYNHFLDTTVYNQLGFDIYIDIIRQKMNKADTSRTLFNYSNDSIIAKHLNKNNRVNVTLNDLTT